MTGDYYLLRYETSGGRTVAVFSAPLLARPDRRAEARYTRDDFERRRDARVEAGMDTAIEDAALADWPDDGEDVPDER